MEKKYGVYVIVSEERDMTYTKRKMLISSILKGVRPIKGHGGFKITEYCSAKDNDEIELTHIKRTGVISFEDFLALIDSYADEIEDTMGTLSEEYGWLPAVSFKYMGQNYGWISDKKMAYLKKILKDKYSDYERLMGYTYINVCGSIVPIDGDWGDVNQSAIINELYETIKNK